MSEIDKWFVNCGYDITTNKDITLNDKNNNILGHQVFSYTIYEKGDKQTIEFYDNKQILFSITDCKDTIGLDTSTLQKVMEKAKELGLNE